MTTINGNNYVIRHKGPPRNWWLIKAKDLARGCKGYVDIGRLILPEEFVGKKIRIKVEMEG